jgi:hypothetical protein
MNNKDAKNNQTTNELQSISQALHPLVRKIAGKNGFVEIDIITNWSEIVGNILAQNSTPQKIIFPKNQKDNGVLYLAVQSGAFAVEIKHREKYILDKINTYFGYKAISTIKIMQNNDVSSNTYKPKLNSTPPPNKLDDETSKKIKNMCNDIKNEKLKEILIKLGHSIYTDNQQKKKDNEI